MDEFEQSDSEKQNERVKLGGRTTEFFSVGLQRTGKGLKAKLSL